MSLHPQLQSWCRTDEALQAFAQDAYQCSLAYGPQDVRSSLAYYNLAKVFQGMQELEKTLACCDQVGHCLSLLGCAYAEGMLHVVQTGVVQQSRNCLSRPRIMLWQCFA